MDSNLLYTSTSALLLGIYLFYFIDPFCFNVLENKTNYLQILEVVLIFILLPDDDDDDDVAPVSLHDGHLI